MALNYFRLPILLYCTATLLSMTTAGTVAPSESASRNVFASDLLRVLATERTEENVIYSPASIQSCLTLAFIGADGNTAEEMRTGLKLGAGTKESIGQSYAQFINSNFKNKQSNAGITLKMANAIYVNQNLEISPEFNNIAKTNFESKVEKLNFANSPDAVKEINEWVEQETENKIQNLLTADSVNQDTSAILVNAIYFKGLWAKQFSDSSTRPTDFFTSSNEKVQVDMMFLDDKFKYAEIPSLNARAIELPYENSDLSMLLILPENNNGLKDLESKLVNMDLNTITSQMELHDVDVLLPKFKIELDIDLKGPLKKLGMSSMFENNANLTKLFSSDLPQKISDVRHKAYLNVNEAGSEAAAATFLKIVPMSLNLQQKRFEANHPFVFAIRNNNAVYFAGHVSKF